METLVSSFMKDSKGQVDSEVDSVGWNTELETGIDVLDGQHRRYVELLNNYIERANENITTYEQKNVRLTESLVFLREYAEEHFSTEESIMRDAEFPGYEEHVEEHVYFLRHVGELCNDLETKGFSPGLFREVNYYTIEWFIQHILLLDMQLADFLKARH